MNIVIYNNVYHYEVSYCIGLTTEIFRFFSVACCERFVIFCIFSYCTGSTGESGTSS